MDEIPKEISLEELAPLLLEGNEVAIRALVIMSYFDEDGKMCLTIDTCGDSTPTSDLGLLTWGQHILFERMAGID